MGQTKGSGFNEVPTLTKDQISQLNQILGQAGPAFQGAAQGFQQFLPGGGGGKSIIDAAHQRFQQQTIPSIMNAFGTGSKGSSALNQALAAGASNLNTDLASQLSQMQLQAAQGLGQLGGAAGSLGTTPQFALQADQGPAWLQKLKGGLSGGVAGAGAGAPFGPWGAAAGGAIGAAGGLIG